MSRGLLAGALAVAWLAVGTTDAAAQRRPPRPKGPPKFEVAGSVVYLQGQSMGTKNAEEVANQTGGSPFTLFATSTDLGAAVGAEARVGYYLTPMIQVEAGALFSRPSVSTSISGDTEGAPAITAVETLQQYIVDGSLVLNFTNAAFAGRRAIPFVSVGGGYLRQLHQDSQLVETGQSIQAGGGFKLWFAGRRARVGVRADARAYFMSGGFDLQDKRRTILGAGVGVVYKF